MSGPDRSQPPGAGPAPPLHAPELWRSRSKAGVSVIGTSHGILPTARVSLALPAGRLAETSDTLGLASLTAALLEEGTQRRSTIELTDGLDGLGATLHCGVSEDELVLSLGVLEEHLPTAVELLEELVFEPGFRDEDFERLKRNRLVAIETRPDRIRELANDAFAERVHGAGAPKGTSALGTRATIESLAVNDVRDFWKRCRRPERARLAYVGPCEQSTLLELLDSMDQRWGSVASAADASVVPDKTAPERAARQLVLIDVPGAQQSELRVGHLGVARSDPDFDPLRALNHILGGSFSSRINLNLREDKGYTYGAHSSFRGEATPGEFTVATAVTTEHTVAALREILGELQGIQDGVKEEELEFARRAMTRSLLRGFESSAALMALAGVMGKYELPPDYLERRLAWLETMQAESLTRLAQKHIRPNELVLVVAGDGASLRHGLEAAADLPDLDVVTLPGAD